MSGDCEGFCRTPFHAELDYLPSFSFALNEGALLGSRFVTIHVEIALFSSWIAVVAKHDLLGASHASLLLLARNGHSLLASTQKLDRPTAMTLCVRSSNTTYSPGDNASSSLIRMLADARSFTASNRQKLPSGFFFRMSNGECMDTSCVACAVRQTEGGKEMVTLRRRLRAKDRQLILVARTICWLEYGR